MTIAVTANPFGRFLVRKRTTFTWIVPILLFVCSLRWGVFDQAAYVAGLACIVAGEAIRIWAAGYIQKDNTIATGGPYAFVRNPLYFGSLLLAVGYVLLSGLGVRPGGSPLVPVVAWVCVMALFALFHLAAIFSEERFLRGKFGAPYEAYLRTVPRLLPRPLPARSSGEGRFAWSQALYNRELTTAVVTLAVCVVFTLRFVLPPLLGH